MAIILTDKQVKDMKFILKSILRFPKEAQFYALEIGAILENGKVTPDNN